MSAHFLQVLIQVLAEQSEAQNIHIIGYSAGSRVVITSLYHLALLHRNTKPADIHKELRVGHVILIGSDFDRDLFSAYLTAGLLGVPNDFTIYISEKDKAMGLSRWFLGHERLGDMLDIDTLNPRAVAYLENQPNLRAINVTSAEGATAGNGHDYLRSSPWVSSDMLVTLMYDLEPEKRGLVRTSGSPVWRFPEDYPEGLMAVIKDSHPALFK